MGIYKAEAIVLRSMVYKEADRILTLFTREEGKVSAIARGVRKTTSRLRGAVQLFSHTHLVLYSGRSLDTVSQGDAEEHFSYLEQDLERFSTASYCAELVDRLTQAREQQPKVFFLLLSALRALKNGNPFDPVGEFNTYRFTVKSSTLLEIGELSDLHAIQPDLPAQTPGTYVRGFPIILHKSNIMRPQIKTQMRKTVQVEIDDIIR
jgi:DNA repair protein RecO